MLKCKKIPIVAISLSFNNNSNGIIPIAFDVKPGIIGYAQIKMKREHNPEFKAHWDSEYVKRMSLWFDTKIFVYTILKLFGAVKGR